MGLLIVLGVVGAEGSGESETLTARQYWYFEKKGLLDQVRPVGDELVGTHSSRHGLVSFRVKTHLVNDPEARTLGYRDALADLVSVVTYGSGEDAVRRAREGVQALTGVALDKSEVPAWFKANSDYLVWSDRERRLVIDEEARQRGVPTLDYRKGHPWTQQP